LVWRGKRLLSRRQQATRGDVELSLTPASPIARCRGSVKKRTRPSPSTVALDRSRPAISKARTVVFVIVISEGVDERTNAQDELCIMQFADNSRAVRLVRRLTKRGRGRPANNIHLGWVE
jgi:hypothetical protein